MKKLLCFLICVPILGTAQDKGINFEHGLTWEQIKAKAKAENKYIFVDCFATWCGPCKLMDKEVYPKEKVGDYLNAHFISVKVQMDTSTQDKEDIKKWYVDARVIQEQNKVTAFPTYLFFSPQGRIVYKDFAAVRDSDFVKLASRALNPAKQYYLLVEKYNQGQKNYAEMPFLITTSQRLKENALAKTIAEDYLNNYLYKLDDENKFFTKQNIEIVSDYIQSSSEKGFRIFFHESEKINKIMEIKGYASWAVYNIVTKEEINPTLWPDNKPFAGTPDWKKLIKKIEKKYNRENAEHIILNAQQRWYGYKKDWPEIVKYGIIEKEKYGIDTSGLGMTFLNNFVFEIIFTHSNDTAAINQGIKWMEIILKARPNDAEYIDTYANLLYKIGRVKEGIALEEKAVMLHPKDKGFQNTLKKMQHAEATWGKE